MVDRHARVIIMLPLSPHFLAAVQLVGCLLLPRTPSILTFQHARHGL